MARQSPAPYASPGQRQQAKRYSVRKDESPSRQLHFELERALEKLHIHDHELQKIHAFNRRSYHEELDARDVALAKSHMAALEAASAKHEAVRQEAEAVLHRHIREEEEKRRKKEEEERLRLEREAKEKAERERQVKEEAERQARLESERREAEAKAQREAAEKAKAEVEEKARQKREAVARQEEEAKAKAEKEKSDKEASDKAKAEREAADEQAQAKARAEAAKSRAPTQTVPSGQDFYQASPEAEGKHREYLALHKKLKTFRKDFWEQAKQNKQLKAAVGEMRRAMRTSVGQLTDDKVGNKKAVERVKSALQQALTQVPSPPVALNDYLPTHLTVPNDNTQVPSLVVYLLSIFSKAIVSAFSSECAVNTKAAEPIGTLTAQIFSLSELQFSRPDQQPNFVSLISILMAKMHKVAPILFGISGPETTAPGRMRLGWRTEGDSPTQKAFITEQRHHERMTGLGAGYSSIALRNFSKSPKLRNPFPPVNFWTSLAGIINTPAEQVQTSHLLLLKSMLENNATDRFVLFFGAVGVAALREALVNFPARLPDKLKQTPACRALGLMVDDLGKDKYFHLN